jgi:hypothetical protein
MLLNAGHIAQIRFFSDVPPEDSEDDRKQIDTLLSEMFDSSSEAWRAAKFSLWDQAEKLVNEHWPVIDALAETVWAKPWTDRVMLPAESMGWSKDIREKSMDAQEVQAILMRFGLTAIIRPDAAGSYSHSLEP